MSRPNGLDHGPTFDSIIAGLDLAEIAARYGEVKRKGSEWVTLCPFHNDSHPSLTIWHGNDGKQRFKCHACGEHGDAIDFIAGIEGKTIAEVRSDLVGGTYTPSAIPPAPPPADASDDWTPILPVPDDAPGYDPTSTYNPKRGRSVRYQPVAMWDYRDASGRLLGYVVRLEIDGKKLTPTVTFCEGPNGARVWAVRRFPSPRSLMGADRLAANPGLPVVVVEGEKAAEAAQRALTGHVVVTWPNGTNNVARAAWNALDGRDVVLWPDADHVGHAAMREIPELCTPRRVRWIDTTGLPAGFDAADLEADGMDQAAFRAAVLAFCKERVRNEAPEKDGGGDGSEGKAAAPGSAATADQPPAPAKSDDTGRSSPPQYAEPPRDLMSQQSAEVIQLPTRPPRAELDTAADPDEDGLPEMYSEDNVALRFSQIHADDLRYVSAWGRWMRWDGRRWKPDDSLMAFDLARKVCRSVASYVRTDATLTPKQQQAVATKYGQAVTVAAIERLAKADRRHAATTDQWDADLWALNTPGGVLDLRTGALRAPLRGDHMTKLTNVTPGGACPTWRNFLNVATQGDLEMQSFLQRVAGYSLTGSTRDHALFFVYGTGGNGKGTFLNTLTNLLGDYAQPASMEVFTESKGDRHPTELASLRGARLVSAQETEEGKRWAEAKIKALTGGDPIRARYMRQDEFTFIPQFKLIIAGNHKPGLRNVDEAIKRRLHLIPFTVSLTPEQKDPELPEKLMAEGGGILQWAVDGCLEWHRTGLRPPASVLAATDEYLEQQDTLGAWIEECCETGNVQARSSVLYASFKAWADRAGEFALPMKRWVGAMESRGMTSRKSGGVMVYDGIRVRVDADEAFRFGADRL